MSRTTITLDPDVQELVDQTMRTRGVPFRVLVNETLRESLRPPRPSTPLRTLSLGGARPGIDLHHATRLAAELDDQEIARKLELRK